MYKRAVSTVLVASLFSGCASVPMESPDKSSVAKQFKQPSNGSSGVYIFRSGSLGGALKKDVWLDGKCIGESAPNIFFYETVKGDVEHKISTESEFSPNDLLIKTESGKNYFVRQYIKIGVFVGGAGVELVSDEKGKEEVAKLELAKTGICSK